MKIIAPYSTIPLLLLIIFLSAACNVQAQDVFREIDQLKKDMSNLRNELEDLRKLVYGLRKALLESAIAEEKRTAGKNLPKEEQPVKPKPAVDDKQLTKSICQAVGEFFSEAESVLSSGTPDAEPRMRAALEKLNSALHQYSRTHRVSKLLNIYEGLAWDTYTAVELSQSVAGNEDFIKVLKKHKQRYIDTCPRD